MVHPMPDEGSYVVRMVEDLHAATEKMETAIDGFDRVLRGHNGSEGLLTRLSHIERTAKENRAEMEKLRNSVDLAIRRPRDDAMDARFWGKVTLIVAAVGGVMELITRLAGG